MAQQQRYKVLEKIASGGMAEVFRAESAGLEGFKKTVAIKRVLPHLSEKKQFIGMFLDEARLSAHLSHSNCVQVFDIGVGDNAYFIVMEYVDGADLKAIIEHRRKLGSGMPFEEACLICVRLCEGLAYAHELKDSRGHGLRIVHRDLSPPNVLITRHGEVKIVDFGLAKANSQLERSEPGIIKGKFSYLAPEAATGAPVDGRTDIFAVGIILWELLANRRLFLADTDFETVRLVQAAHIPPLRPFNALIPAQLDAILAKALAADPAQRYPSARDLGQDLNAMLFKSGRPVSSFDIARLVEPVRGEREAKSRQRTTTRSSIIGSLIEEELFEFLSLQADAGSEHYLSGAVPLALDAFRANPPKIEDWASQLSDLSSLTPSQQQAVTRSPESEPFNLAALEEEPTGQRRALAPEPPEGIEQNGSRSYDTDSASRPGGPRKLLVAGAVLAVLTAATASYLIGAWY
ncbi:serine/threonine protein kinase [Myxococcota bacterium]